MREIKFRVFAADNKLVDWGALKQIDIKNWIDNRFIKIMQYTGLKDKNGKEIYEGDIVRIAGYKSNEMIVEWDSIGFKLVYPSGFASETKLYERELEVIGNIYENKDLLTK